MSDASINMSKESPTSAQALTPVTNGGPPSPSLPFTNEPQAYLSPLALPV